MKPANAVNQEDPERDRATPAEVWTTGRRRKGGVKGLGKKGERSRRVGARRRE